MKVTADGRKFSLLLFNVIFLDQRSEEVPVSELLRVGVPLLDPYADLGSLWCHINQPAAPGWMSSL